MRKTHSRRGAPVRMAQVIAVCLLGTSAAALAQEAAERDVSVHEAARAAEEALELAAEATDEAMAADAQVIDVPSGELTPEMIERLMQEHGVVIESSRAVPAARAAANEPPAAEPEPAAEPLDADQRAAMDAVIAELGVMDDEQLAAAEIELAAFGPEVMVPLKIAALSDDFDQRRAAGRLARRLRWRLTLGDTALKANADAIDTLTGEDPQARATMVDMLIAAGAGVPFLGECLADDQPYIRQRAIDAMTQRGMGNEQVRRHLDAALDDTDMNIRLLAIGAMVKLRMVDVDRLAKMLDDPSLEVRMTVVHAMGHSRQPRAMNYVKALLTDPRWQMRAAALEALEDLVDQRSAGAVGDEVVKLLADPDPFVREFAAKLIGRWQYRDGAKVMWAMVDRGELDRELAIAALAGMTDSRALAIILDEQADAASPDERMRWLTLLDPYRDNVQADSTLLAALRDDAMRPHLPRLIQLTSYRQNWQTFYDELARLLESDDPAIAEAAWEGVAYRLDERPLDAGQLQRMLASGDAQQGRWVLAAEHMATPHPTAVAPVYIEALAHPDATVVREAVGHIARIVLRDDLDALVQDSGYGSFHYYGMTEHLPPPPGLDKTHVTALRAAAQRDDWQAQVAAAALLYRVSSAARDDDAIRDILHAALAHDEPDAQRIAMAGIVDHPDAFLDNFDIEAAAKDDALRERAITIMATATDERYLPTLLELAKSATTDDVMLWKAMVRSGDEQAIATTIKAFSGLTVDRWDRRHFVTQLRDMPGPGPVRLIETMLRQVTEGHELEEYAQVAATLPDESASALLDTILNHPALKQDPYYAQSILSEAIGSAPERHLERIEKLLADPNQQMRYNAAQAVLRSRSKSEPLLALMLDAARAEQSREDAWLAQLPGWASPEALRAQALPVLTDFHTPFQASVLQRIEYAVEPDDVALLLATPYEHWRIREQLAAMVGDAVLAYPDRRPNPDALDEPALVIALAAAADWHDAEPYVTPFLHDPRREVADAARRTLALSLLARPADALTDEQRAVLIEATTTGTGVTGYIAAEALGMYDGDALLAIDPQKVRSSLVALRQAVTQTQRGEPIDGQMLARVRKAIAAGPTGTAAQLALYVVAALPDDDKPFNSALLAAMDPRLILRAFSLDQMTWTSDGMAQMLYQVDEADRQALRDKLLEAAADGDDQPLLVLAQSGMLQGPVDDELFARLLRLSPRLHRINDPRYRTLTSLSLLLPLAAREPGEEVIELARATTSEGFVAAVIAAVRAGDEPSIKRLLTTLNNSQLTALHDTALRALALIAPAEAEQPVAAYFHSLARDDWEQLERRGLALNTLARINPSAAIDALAKAAADADEDEEHYYRMDRSLDVKAILPLFADADDFAQRLADAPEPNNRYGYIHHDGDQAPPYSDLLLAQRSAAGGDVPAALLSPWREEHDAHWALTDEQLRRRAGDRLPRIIAAVRLGAAEHAAMHSGDPTAYEQYYTDHDMSGQSAAPDWMFSVEQLLGWSAYSWLSFGMQGVDPTPGLMLDDATLAEALAPLLTDDEPTVRRIGIRLAMAWHVRALAPDIERLLVEDGENLLDAATALALLRGTEAEPALRAAHDATEGFAQRVMLACVLHAMGSDAADDTLDRALAVRLVRQYREKFLNRTPTFGHARMLRDPSWGGGDGAMAWRLLLEHTAGDMTRDADRRFALTPDGLLPRDEPAPVHPPEASLDDLALGFDGALHSASAGDAQERHFQYNMPPTAPFTWLIEAERDLGERYFVQFADRATTAVELAELWRDWWAANRDASPETWWRQGVEQAIEQLTDERWYHRVRGVHRLAVLTGMQVSQPALFDHAGWAALRDAWRERLAGDPPYTSAGAIISAAIDAGHLDEAAAASVRDDQQRYLALLARLAAHAPPRLAQAAEARLVMWPDPARAADALAIEAATSPRGRLRTHILALHPDRSALRLAE